MMSFGQATVPKAEVAFGYSFINVHPGFSQITSYNVNGGGAGLVYNVMPLIGVKAEFSFRVRHVAGACPDHIVSCSRRLGGVS